MNQEESQQMKRSEPIIHMVGNAHLDPAWMWQWGEGMEAFIATCRAAIDRMEETPAFIFTCSSAAHYRWIEENEPELFQRIASYVRNGQWRIVGGWWVQADCNLPSGEGFARQALLGQRYFLERFGRIARTGYSPDAFGHNLGLPQLLARAGMTAYLYCRPDPTELLLPQPLLRWIGPDGSSVLAYRVPFHYNMYESSVPKKVNDLLDAYDGSSSLTADARPLRSFSPEWMLMYGVGNHGGGPTREHIAQIIAIDSDATTPPLRFSDPDTFFESIEAKLDRITIPEWRDDLQLNAPGCYSAHSEIKRLNRKSEHALITAERFSSLASILLGVPYPASELARAWENVCFNHFHDIICGVAIKEALEDAIEMYGESLAIAQRATRNALRRIASGIDTTGQGQTLVLFNPHAWDVSEHITFELWHDIDKALWLEPVDIRITDDEGMELPCQLGFTSGKIGKDRIAVTFKGSVPALGWRCYRVFYGEKRSADATTDISADDGRLENAHLRVTIDRASGAIASIHHKESGREILAGSAARGVVIDDKTDTWGHGRSVFDDVIGFFGDAETRLVEYGPAYATIRARSRWGSSWLQQDYTLRSDARELQVAVKLFWGEERKMLKLEFPCRADAAEGYYESAYSITRKPCDGTERPGGVWGAIVGTTDGAPAGIGIVNDAKYGYSASTLGSDASAGAGSCNGASLSLTALRSPSYATHDPHPFNPDEDLDFIDQGVQRFRYAIIPITSEGWPESLARAGALLNAPLFTQLESAHASIGVPLGRGYQGISVAPSSVIVTVVKRDYDGEGWALRLYETSGKEASVDLTLSPLELSWRGALAPHEVKTLLVRNGAVVECSLLELPQT